MRDKKRKAGSKPRIWVSHLIYGSLLVLNFARIGSGEEKSFTDTIVSSIDFGE